MKDEKSQPSLEFTQLLNKVLNDESPKEKDKDQLHRLASDVGGFTKQELDPNGKPTGRSCYWVCSRNNTMCNPENPPPNCKCVWRCI